MSTLLDTLDELLASKPVVTASRALHHNAHDSEDTRLTLHGPHKRLAQALETATTAIVALPAQFILDNVLGWTAVYILVRDHTKYELEVDLRRVRMFYAEVLHLHTVAMGVFGAFIDAIENGTQPNPEELLLIDKCTVTNLGQRFDIRDLYTTSDITVSPGTGTLR